MKSMVTVASALLILMAASAQAAERVHAGQWETVLTTKQGAGTTTAACLTAAEAAFVNGDAAGLRKHLEESMTKNTRGRCTVKDVKVTELTVIVLTACGSNEMTATTTYHGDRFDTLTTSGTTITGRRLGACK